MTGWWFVGAVWAQDDVVGALSAIRTPEDALIEVANRSSVETDPTRVEALAVIRDALVLFVEEEVNPRSSWPTIVTLLWDPATRDQGQSYVRAALLGTTPETAMGDRSPIEEYGRSRLAWLDLAFDYTRLVSRPSGVDGQGRPLGNEPTLIHRRYDARVVVDGAGTEIDRSELALRVDPAAWASLGYDGARDRVKEAEVGPLIEAHNGILAEELGLVAADVDALEAQPFPHWSERMPVCPVTVRRGGLSSRAIEQAFPVELPGIGRACRGRTKFGRVPD